MATYKEIKGVTIQTRAKDPTVNAGTNAVEEFTAPLANKTITAS